MIKTVNLETLKFCRFDGASEYIIADNDELILSFRSSHYIMKNSLVAITNGKIKRTYYLSGDMRITVPAELKQVGKLNISVLGERDWVVDSIIIKQADDNIILESAFTELKAEFDERIKVLTAEIAGIKQTLATAIQTETSADTALSDAVETLSKQIQTIKVALEQQIKNVSDSVNLLTAEGN